METTLVIMAAGMGSRFGGLKQAAAITPDGKGILDFSCYDAKKAGFSKIVFILRKDIIEEFKERIGNRIASKMDVEYVIQDTTCLPEGRSKPFGTAHAIYCCKDVVKTPFCIINADDYYGSNAFKEVEKHLENAKEGQYAMVAYQLGKTLSSNGSVSRGVCNLTADSYLKDIEEVTKIDSVGKCVYQGKEQTLPLDTPVSMNLWGLTPGFFKILEREYEKFLKTADLSKDEFLVPRVIGDCLTAGEATVKAYHNKDKWYGITYKEDLPEVQQAISKYVADGLYEEI